MTDEPVAAALRAMGHRADVRGEPLAGSLSGAHVRRLRLGATEVVLKVTVAGAGQRQARRELLCYRDLSGELPVALPRLLDWVDTDEFTAVLITAHRPAAPAAEWSDAEWLELADQIGALHGMPARLGTEPEHWLIGVLNEERGRRMAPYWQRAAGPALERILYSPERLIEAIQGAPVSFLHGDCHLGNLLRADDGTLLWADWQAVAIGPGIADLTFPWLRAEPDGGNPPRAQMVQRYARTRGVDAGTIHRASTAAELGGFLFTFPEYAHWNSSEGCARVTRRVLELAADWPG